MLLFAGEFDVINGTCSTCRITIVYKAPSRTRKSVDWVHSLIEQLQILSTARTHCILVGDLNCPHISWKYLTAPSDNLQDALLDLTVNNSLEQLVNNAKRGDHILDLVPSSELTSIAQIEIICLFSSSDHCQDNFNIVIDSNTSTQPAMYKNSTGSMQTKLGSKCRYQ